MQTPRTRRPRLSYANVTATLALVIATSMGGAYAHGMIGSSDIKKNAVKSKHIAKSAVTTPDLKSGAVKRAKIANKAVTLGKLAPGNRPAHVTTFKAGGHNFVAEDQVFLKLPGVTAAQVANSDFAVAVVGSDSGATLNLPLAYGDTGEAPYTGVIFVPPGVLPGLTGTVALVADINDVFDGFDAVTGFRVTMTTRPTATKGASKVVPRGGQRLPLP